MKKTCGQNILLSVLMAVFVVVIFSQPVFAGEFTKSVSNGDTITFRNITDFSPAPDPQISLDKDFYLYRDVAELTVIDSNANLDYTGIDFANAEISGSSLTLVETGPNTSTFTGSFNVEGEFNVSYTGNSPEAARAKVTLPLSSSGNVILSDVGFDETELVNIGIKPVTGAINVELADGAVLSGVPTVEISFANANLDDGNIDILDLEMWYKAPNQNWELVTFSCNTQIGLLQPCDYFDYPNQTIKSQSSPIIPSGGFDGATGEGSYVLAINVGLGGGGGGGLVRPSLVVNALAGVGSLGGGNDASPPILNLSNLILYSQLTFPPEIEQMVLNHDASTPIQPMEMGLFENFEYPMTINDKGFVLGGFSNTIKTQTLKVGEKNTIKFTLYESTKIQHISLYTNLRDANTQIYQSDTQILYNDNLPLLIKDPNGFFQNATVTINDLGDNKKQAVFEITFAKEMDTSDIIIRSWDPALNSFDTFILDAIQVVSEIQEEAPLPTYEEPVIQELKSQTIPIWIKNNAAWWSDEQIGDDDFIAGIQYLIKNGIIQLSEVPVTDNSSDEIPDWIKNNAGWWSDSLITDRDFVDAMQWLVANGVIQI